MPKTRKHSKSGRIVRSDSRGRVHLGPGIADKDFLVEYAADGAISLIPIPEREAWLYRNEQALEQVRQGLADAAAGRVTELKSFAEYADIEID